MKFQNCVSSSPFQDLNCLGHQRDPEEAKYANDALLGPGYHNLEVLVGFRV